MKHELRVLFRAAAGPELGFGHLVRCGVLGRVLGAPLNLSLRPVGPVEQTARQLGWTLVAPGRRGFDKARPDVVVIDDPSMDHAAEWVDYARSAGVAVASIHDLGIGRVDSDLSIDASLTLVPGTSRADLQGPAYTVLDPAIAALRQHPVTRVPGRVLVALGGGEHVRHFGPILASKLRRHLPRTTIRLAGGFRSAADKPALPHGCTWIDAPNGLASELALASVAVLAGGVTLAEGCALGTPIVALAVNSLQQHTIRAFVNEGAVLSAGPVNVEGSFDCAASRVTQLLTGELDATWLGRRASQIVDGFGAVRVADSIRGLAAAGSSDVPHKSRAVVFDLDDTLYPYRQFVRSGFVAVAAHLARTQGIDARAAFRLLQRAARDSRRGREIQACLRAFDLPQDLAPSLIDVFVQHTPSLRLPPTSRQALTLLRRDGWRLAVLTNGDRSVQERKVAALGLSRYVDTIVFACAYGPGKPDATPFLAVANRLEVPVSRAVMVGDDERCDVRGAAAVGMRTMRLTSWTRDTSGSRADVVARSMKDVPRQAHQLIEESRESHAV